MRARAAALQLHLGLVPGFGVLHGFGLGLGFPLDPGGVVAGGLPFGLLLPRCAGRPDRPVLAARPAGPPCRRARVHPPGSSLDPAWVLLTGPARVRAGVARGLRRRWRPGAGGRWRVRRLRCRPRTAATIRSSSAAGPRAAPAGLLLAGPARAAGVRPGLFRRSRAWSWVSVAHCSYRALPASSRSRSAVICKGQGPGAGRAGLVVPGLGVGGLGERVGFGLRGEPQLCAHVGRGAGLGAVPVEDLGLELAAGHAADDGGSRRGFPGRGWWRRAWPPARAWPGGG